MHGARTHQAPPLPTRLFHPADAPFLSPRASATPRASTRESTSATRPPPPASTAPSLARSRTWRPSGAATCSTCRSAGGTRCAARRSATSASTSGLSCTHRSETRLTLRRVARRRPETAETLCSSLVDEIYHLHYCAQKIAFFACIVCTCGVPHLRDRVSFVPPARGHVAHWSLARVVVARKRETTVAETWASWAATTHQAATAWRIRRRGAREWAIGHTENYVDGTACITVHMRSVHYILSNKTSLNPSARTQGPLQTDLATRRRSTRRP